MKIFLILIFSIFLSKTLNAEGFEDNIYICKMQKKVLTEQSLFYGNVDMPKGFEINRNELAHYILHTKLTEKKFPFSKTWDMLNTYIREHINLKHKIKLINKETWGEIYCPLETSTPLININILDLKNSADYTLLYGVNVRNCIITIYNQVNDFQ